VENKKFIQKTQNNLNPIFSKEIGMRQDKLSIIYITPLGEKASHFDDDKALGKMVVDKDGALRYYIKCNGNRQPYNPYDREYELNSRRISLRLGKAVYQYESISLEGLNIYISYLKTREPKYYRQTMGALK
jgi:hypothetical protein